MSIADKSLMCCVCSWHGNHIGHVDDYDVRHNTTHVGADNGIFSPSIVNFACTPLMCLLFFGVPHNLTSLYLDSFNAMYKSVAFPLSL